MTTIRQYILPFLALLLTAGIVAGCKSKKEEETEAYTPSSSTAITAFNLRANKEIMEKLDSVFFSIDLDRGIIFNADSLPKGTDVSSLGINITTPSGAKGVSVTYTNEEGEEVAIDYLANSLAKIDFRTKVGMTVVAQDGVTARQYEIRLNVHQSDPERFAWSQTSVAGLPSRLPTPAAQKSFRFADKICSIIKESDGTYTLSTSTDLPSFVWTKEELRLPFVPDLTSLQAGEGRLFLLSEAGDLYFSTDARSWEGAGEQWESITGPYLEGVVGIRATGTERRHVCWPAGLTPELTVSADFPVAGSTNPALITTPWSQWPTLILTGGRKADGTLSDATWGFDGTSWTIISSSRPVATAGAMLIPYWTTRPSADGWNATEHNSWLLIGGTLADGTPNRSIWFSPDNGVNWRNGGEEMLLPEEIAASCDADGIVWILRRNASATAWQRRMNTTVEGSTILWDCPEIYIFGGRDAAAAPLSDTVWRAVLTRFTFVPLI